MLNKGNALVDETSRPLVAASWQDAGDDAQSRSSVCMVIKHPFPTLTHHQTEQVEDGMPGPRFSL